MTISAAPASSSASAITFRRQRALVRIHAAAILNRFAIVARFSGKLVSSYRCNFSSEYARLPASKVISGGGLIETLILRQAQDER